MQFKTALPLLVVLTAFSVSGCPVFAQTTGSSSAKPAPRDLLIQKVASKSSETRDGTMKAMPLQTAPTSREASLSGKIASRSAVLMQKLQSFRDKKKATIIERINDNLMKVNERRSSAMMQHIDAMSALLSKAETRAVGAQEAGTDVSAAQADLAMAKTELTKAKAAVDDQSKKTYEITITTEATAKTAVKSTRDLLETDLKTTHGLVKESRRLLINALTKLAQSLGEGGTGN